MSRAWWREPTPRQYAAFGAAWAGWVLDAFDFTIFFLAMPLMVKDLGSTTAAVSSSITLTLVMRLGGGYLAGVAADRWKRKVVLMASVVWLAACDAAVAFAPSLGWIIALRMLFGLGMGAEWTAGTTLAMESWPARSRGIASGVLQGSWALGYLVAAPVSAWVLPRYGWRALFLCASISALVVVPIRFLVREERTAAPRRKLSAKDFSLAGEWSRIAWASLVMTLGFGAYYALVSTYPTRLSLELGLGPREVAVHVALFNVGMLVGSVICGLTAARRGITSAVVVPALLALPLLPLYLGIGFSPRWLGAGALLVGAAGVGWAGVVPVFLTALFPEHVRARAVGVVYHVAAFGAAFVATAVPMIASASRTSLGWSIAVVAATCEVGLAVLLLASARRAPATVRGAS